MGQGDGCPVPQSRPKWAGDPCGKGQYSYCSTSSKSSFSRSVYITVQKCVREVPTEQPFLLMCGFHGHIDWYLQARTLLGLALTHRCPKIYLLRTRYPKSLPCVRMWPPCVQRQLLFLHPYTPRFKGRWTRIIYWMNTWLPGTGTAISHLLCVVCYLFVLASWLPKWLNVSSEKPTLMLTNDAFMVSKYTSRYILLVGSLPRCLLASYFTEKNKSYQKCTSTCRHHVSPPPPASTFSSFPTVDKFFEL